MTQNINKELESGRSMVEMLGTLAVIGVLSVGAIVGYRYAMDKHGANDLLSGASQRAVLVEAQIASGREATIAEFEQYKETAGGTIERVEVFLDNSFGFGVTGVKGPVCELIIEMVEDRPIRIMSDDGETLTEMSEEDCDHENPNHFMILYEVGEGIKCDPEKALSCMDDSGNGWCCGAGLICDIENQGCKAGDGKCTYYFNESDETSEYTTDCSYTLSDESNVEYYYSNCYYTVGSTPSVTSQVIGNTTQSLSHPNVSASATRGGCPPNQYCTLLWTGTPIETQGNKYIFASKPASAGAGMTGILYGKCQTLSGNDSTPLTENKNGSGQMMGNGARGGCPENQYCLLMWKQQSWTGTGEPKLTASDTGEMYGKCQTLSGNDATPKIAEGSTFTRYRMGQGCPIGQYCRLLWKNESCTNLAASDTGGLSGVCLSLSGPTPGTIDCPYEQ